MTLCHTWNSFTLPRLEITALQQSRLPHRNWNCWLEVSFVMNSLLYNRGNSANVAKKYIRVHAYIPSKVAGSNMGQDTNYYD
jgi:hypothetical protein